MESLRKRAFPQRNATRTNAVIGYLKLYLKLSVGQTTMRIKLSLAKTQ